MDIASISRPGGRKVNEDSVGYLKQGGCFFGAVADGLGGHGSGDEASDCVVDHLKDALLETVPEKERLRALVYETNKLVMETCSGKTTLALVWGREDACFSCHVGDSRIYQFRDGEILFQSRDHSVSQLAAAVGEITQEEIRGHVDRNKLIRSLGSRDGGLPEVHALELQPGDSLLLCSDGFWELVLEEEMLETRRKAASPKAWLHAMEKLIKKRLTANSDNYSAVALFY